MYHISLLRFITDSGIIIYSFDWSLRRLDHLQSIAMYQSASHIQINNCEQLPVYHFKDVYACVRAFTTAGQKVQTCEKLRRPASYNAIATRVYDFDAHSESWNKVKSV